MEPVIKVRYKKEQIAFFLLILIVPNANAVFLKCDKRPEDTLALAAPGTGGFEVKVKVIYFRLKN